MRGEIAMPDTVARILAHIVPGIAARLRSRRTRLGRSGLHRPRIGLLLHCRRCEVRLSVERPIRRLTRANWPRPLLHLRMARQRPLIPARHLSFSGGRPSTKE
jgi:hypothetical protein